jgi:hypothetical protein
LNPPLGNRINVAAAIGHEKDNAIKHVASIGAKS